MNKKIVGTFLGLSVLASVALPSFAQAGNDNHGYYFEIRPFSGNNSNGDTYYRQTTNTANAWKVYMSNSTEGAGTITNYWIDGNKGMASGKVSAKVGYEYLRPANSNGSKAYVNLVGENNNYTVNGHSVSGSWDEETGIILK